MQNDTQLLAERLEREGQKTQDFFNNITNDKWEIQVYSDGPAWTVRQVFAHIVEVEGSIPRLIGRILKGGSGVPEDFDLDRYNKSQVNKMNEITPDQLLHLFIEKRAENVRMVKSLNQNDLEKEGRHASMGDANIAEMFRMMYMNAKLHQRDIKQLLQDS